jgi:hypothetical protein
MRKSNFKIFNENVNFEARPKIDTFNKNYRKNGGDVEVK